MEEEKDITTEEEESPEEESTPEQEEDATTEEEPQQSEDDNSLPDEPPIRKTADYWRSEKERLEAKRARAEYFKAKQSESEYEEDTSQDDPISLIRKELEPIKQAFKTQADEREFQDAFKKYPEAKKLESTIRKYADVYSNVPIEGIVKMVMFGRDQQKAEADNKAKASRLGGHSRRPTEPKTPNFSAMSDKEFEEYERAQRAKAK